MTGRRSTAKTPSWPLGEAQYLSTPSIARDAVSDGPAVLALREALGLEPGIYNGVARSAVRKAQEDAGLAATGVVTSEDWAALMAPKPRTAKKAAPSGTGVRKRRPAKKAAAKKA